MDNFQPKYVKDQIKAQEEVAKNTWTLSYRIKGMTGGALIMFLYTSFYLDQSNPKMIILGGILGYFLGWVVGSFFYTKK
ncbi:MAG: hypothetical protein HOE19_02650 [Candidatus Komeilibacteria bacterium]|jgi:hypothetical protein|nr:hypothetical protein [Candidatus Komeilibacteria bacterium]MBT4447309.1 hypothetical protein [Candidatus Komeilibacteria bacterium]